MVIGVCWSRAVVCTHMIVTNGHNGVLMLASANSPPANPRTHTHTHSCTQHTAVTTRAASERGPL